MHVIFDLDGTLVDSEGLCNQALLDLLPDLREPLETLVARYRGLKLAPILDDLRRRLGALPADFERDYRQRVDALFATRLQAIEGVPALLDALDLPCCVASNGPPAKIDRALACTGLARHFPSARRFSAYAVGSWKPAPGLFLHAAAAMGVAAAHCVVVEDSTTGMAAVRAAGMRGLHYLPDPAMPAHPQAQRFAAMAALPDLLRGLG